MECRNPQNLILALIIVVLRWFNMLKFSLGGINNKYVQDFMQYSLNKWLLSNDIITALFVCHQFWFWTGWGIQVMIYSNFLFVFHVFLFILFTVKPHQFKVLGPKNQSSNYTILYKPVFFNKSWSVVRLVKIMASHCKEWFFYIAT